MKLNTYGMTMKGLKKASGNTANYGSYGAEYDEIFYNRATGEIWTVYQCSLGGNSWTEYSDDSIVKICDARRHMAMQELADAIRDRVAELDAVRAYA